MTQSVDSNSTEEVEIALAFRIPEIDAATALEKHTLTVIGGQQQLGFGTDDRGQTHATITSVPPSSLV